MRIDKSQAIGALNAEISRLSAQIATCDDQFSRIVSISTPGLEGEAAREFRANVRRYAVVILTHKCFYQAVRNADSQNVSLVSALPTTDGSVLDTEVAAARINAAEQTIARLRMRKERAVGNAQKVNTAIALASTAGGVAVSALIRPIDVDAIARYYDTLIDAQYAIAEHNRMILAMASRYDAQSAALYQAVDANAVRQSTDMMASLLDRGVWGSVAWGVDFLSHNFPSVGFGGQMGAGSTADGGSSAAWLKFFDGDSGVESTVSRMPNGKVSSAARIDGQGAVQASDIGDSAFGLSAEGVAGRIDSGGEAAGIAGASGGAMGSIDGIGVETVSASSLAPGTMGGVSGNVNIDGEHVVSDVGVNAEFARVSSAGIDFDPSDNQVVDNFDFDLGRLSVGLGIKVDWDK